MAQVIVPQSNAGRYLQEGLSSAGSAFADAMKERRALQLAEQEKAAAEQERARKEKLQIAGMLAQSGQEIPGDVAEAIGPDYTKAFDAMSLSTQQQMKADASRKELESFSKKAKAKEELFKQMPVNQDDRAKWIEQNSGVITSAGVEPSSLQDYQFSFGEVFERGKIPTPMKDSFTVAATQMKLSPEEVNVNDPVLIEKAQKIENMMASNISGKALPGEQLVFEVFKDEMNSVNANALESDASLGAIDNALSIMDSTDAPQGKFAKITEFIGGAMESLGIPAEMSETVRQATNIQALEAAFNKLTLRDAARLKGALSNRELGFLQRSNANITNTQEANRYILNAAKMLAGRELERKQFYQNYALQNPNEPWGATKAWQDYKNQEELSGFSNVVKSESGLPIFYHEYVKDVKSSYPNATIEEIKESWINQTRTGTYIAELK